MAVPVKADSSHATKWRIRPLRGRFLLIMWGVAYAGYLWPDIASAMAAIEDVERKP